MNANCVFVRTENWRVRVKPEQSVIVGGNGLFKLNKRKRPCFLSASMKVKGVVVGYKDAKKTSIVPQLASMIQSRENTHWSSAPKENRVDHKCFLSTLRHY